MQNWGQYSMICILKRLRQKHSYFCQFCHLSLKWILIDGPAIQSSSSPLYFLCPFFVITPNLSFTLRTPFIEPTLVWKVHYERKLGWKVEDTKVQIAKWREAERPSGCAEDKGGEEAMMLLKDNLFGFQKKAHWKDREKRAKKISIFGCDCSWKDTS